MDFNSLAFILIFLPSTLLIYYFLKIITKDNKTTLNIALLIFSFVFYVYKAGFLVFFIMAVVALFHYVVCSYISYDNRSINLLDKCGRNALFIADISLSVIILFFYKYCNLLNFGKDIIFPLALSFVTFSSISFTVEVYKGNLKSSEFNIISYFLYIFLFMKMTQGPIVKYQDLKSNVDMDKFIEGIRRFTLGLAIKILIADILAGVVATTFGNVGIIGTGLSWIGIICFTIQLFFDFSGYTDMAIGIGYMFGYELNENFNIPYLSTSITDFWRRWHMTLGTWFKNYVYIPLGGNRKGQIRTLFNLLVVFILTGLWHGSTINFLLWGLYFGFFMLIERMALSKVLNNQKVKLFDWIYSLFVVMMGWVLFNSKDLESAGLFYMNLFTYQKNSSNYSLIGILSLKVTLALIAGVGLAIVYPFIKSILFPKIDSNKYYRLATTLVGICLLIVCIVFITTNSYSPSIYGGF